MAGFDFDGNSKRAAVDWAIPDIMIAFPVPDKSAMLLTENFTDTLFILGHYDTALSRRSDVEKTKVAAFSQPFSSSSSGAA